MAKINISASILNADFGNLESQIRELEESEVAQLHLDIMDGHFVPNISVGPIMVQTCRKICSLPLDTHLMVENPDQYIDECAAYGSTGISVHIEGNPNIHRTLQKIKKLNLRTGIVINPGTPLESIHSVLDLVDLILIMTVNPGYGGQSFIESQLPKITEASQLVAGKNIIIEVDGGINTQTLPLVHQAGASLFVVGSAIFTDPRGIMQSILDLLACIK